jgi:putative salt-induced outer membrane protein YdiY
MGKFKSLLAAAAMVCLAAGRVVLADEVITLEGDHINGTIKSISGGNLDVKSATLGDVIVPMSHVSTFSTDAPITVQLTDGTVITRQFQTSDAGSVLVAGNELGGGQKVLVSTIEDVNPKPFSALVSVGGSLARGNSYSDTLNASLAMEYKVKTEDITFTAEYNYARQKTRLAGGGFSTASSTTDRWDLEGKYEHFFTKKFYAYVDAEVTKDRIAFLDIRFAPTAGVGYTWFDTKPLLFSTEGGFGWLYENYTNGTPSREEAVVRLAYHFQYVFNPSVSLFHDVVYIPSLQTGKDYLINADIGLHAKLTKNLFAELKAEWDYDSAPATGSLKNDARYMASLGYGL